MPGLQDSILSRVRIGRLKGEEEKSDKDVWKKLSNKTLKDAILDAHLFRESVSFLKGNTL